MKAIEEDYQFKGKKEKMLDEGTGFASQDTKLIHYLSPLSWYVLITLVWLSTQGYYVIAGFLSIPHQ